MQRDCRREKGLSFRGGNCGEELILIRTLFIDKLRLIIWRMHWCDKLML